MAGKEKTGRKIRFNILDVAVAVLLLGAVAGIMIRYSVVAMNSLTLPKRSSFKKFTISIFLSSFGNPAYKGKSRLYKPNFTSALGIAIV